MSAPKKNEALKCSQIVRNIPLERYRLPSDGRKWQQAARSRSALLVRLASYANADGTFVRNGRNYSPSLETLQKHIAQKSFYRLTEALKVVGLLSWTREKHYERRIYIIHLLEQVQDSSEKGSDIDEESGVIFNENQVSHSAETDVTFASNDPNQVSHSPEQVSYSTKSGVTMGDHPSSPSKDFEFTSSRDLAPPSAGNFSGDIPICDPIPPTPATSARASSGNSPATDFVSKEESQGKPPTAVTCSQVGLSGAGLDTKRGAQLQKAVSRIAKLKLQNHRHIPKNLTVKFELLATAHGIAAVSQDFGKWCDENPIAKRQMPYPIHEYVKDVDSRFGNAPAEPSDDVKKGIQELGDLSYELTNILTTKKQTKRIAEVLKVIPIAALKRALTFYVNRLTEDPTSSLMTSFWSVANINAVLKAEHNMREAMEDDEDVRKVPPAHHDLQALKRRVGTLPFAQRLVLSDRGYSSCPFHKCDSDTNFHVERQDDGVGIGTCFSDCAKSFDAIAFVEKFDKISIGSAIRKLVLLRGDIDNGSASAGLPPKPKPSPMTIEKWMKLGRAVTESDVATLAASRLNSRTPSAATLNAMGFKIGSWDHLIAPYRLGDIFYTLKARSLAKKGFIQENAVSSSGLFNIDAVTAGCNVYVVESELDAGVLYEFGHVAVSVMNSTQRDIEPEVMTRLLTAGRISLIGDADAAGKKCMDYFAGLLPAEKVYRISPPGVKDVGEWAISAQFQEQFKSA